MVNGLLRTWEAISEYADHYERGELLLEYALDLSDAEYWRAVAEAWQDCERQNLGRDWLWLWTAVCSNDAERWQHVMDDQERAQFEALPDRVTVYRGVNSHNSRRTGLSWTLDRDVAHWFGARFPGAEGVVVKGTVLRKRILALFQARHESEIVVLPRYIYRREYEHLDLDARGRRLAAMEELREDCGVKWEQPPW